MTTPDSSPARNFAKQALAAFARAIPVAGVGIDVFMAGLEAAERERDEQFFAFVAADAKITRDRVDAIAAGREPEFVATARRLAREAQETVSEDKRKLLARILANSGSWSTTPGAEREELLALTLQLSTRQIVVLDFLDDPNHWVERNELEWPSYMPPNTRAQAMRYFLARLDTHTFEQLLEVAGELGRLGLIALGDLHAPIRSENGRAGITTPSGQRLIAFIRA